MLTPTPKQTRLVFVYLQYPLGIHIQRDFKMHCNARVNLSYLWAYANKNKPQDKRVSFAKRFVEFRCSRQ